MWPCVSIRVGISECVNMNKTKQLGEVTCSDKQYSLCSWDRGGGCRNSLWAVAGEQELTGSTTVSAAGPGQADPSLLLLVTPV